MFFIVSFMANHEEEDFDALLEDCAQDLEKKLEVPVETLVPEQE